MTKVAAKKTAGVLGDDLAVNAEQVSGVRAERELPVVWAVAKGSMFNKLLIVPAVLAMSALAPWMITPLLILGGLYLCFEGAEKVWQLLFERGKEHKLSEALLQDPEVDLMALEQQKINGAIRTDFILSLEIIVIALSTMAVEPLAKQALGLSVVAVAMTVFVYGLVALIVKIDDMGLHLVERQKAEMLGRFLLWFAPALMKGLTVVGTLAMFLVGGGILIHSAEHYLGQVASLVHWIALTPVWLEAIVHSLINGVLGLVAGLLVMPIMSKLLPDH